MRDPFLTPSNGQGAVKSETQDVWLPDSPNGSGKSNTGLKVTAGKPTNLFSETSPAMEALSLVPGINGTAFAHDQWMGGISQALGTSRVGATLKQVANIGTMAPAAALNYAGALHDVSSIALVEVNRSRDKD